MANKHLRHCTAHPDNKACVLCHKCRHCEKVKDPLTGQEHNVFYVLVKGGYCPPCAHKLIDSGHVWSEYHQDYVKPEKIGGAGRELLDMQKRKPKQQELFQAQGRLL